VPSACGALVRALGSADALGPTEIEAAVGVARHGCGQGDAQACDVLGHLLSAIGPREDESKARADAAEAFDRACWLGFADGCTAVFKLLLGAGATTTAERDSALEHLSLACRIGDPQACSTVAMLYRTGELGVVDLDRARSYTEEGCRMFVPDACVSLV